MEYKIIRDNKSNKDSDFWANDILIDTFIYYKKNHFFISKKKRLKLVKQLSIKRVTDIQNNLSHANWVSLCKSSKKKETVYEFFNSVIESIYNVTNIKYE